MDEDEDEYALCFVFGDLYVDRGLTLSQRRDGKLTRQSCH
jgi:hypothetical protein